MILIIILILFGVSSVHYVAQDSRLATIADGAYQRLLGPGWVVVLPGSLLIQPLQVGEGGTYLGNGLADFSGQVMPVVGAGLAAQAPIEISGFEENAIRARKAGSEGEN